MAKLYVCMLLTMCKDGGDWDDVLYLKRPDYIGRVDRHTVSAVARVENILHVLICLTR